jgi:hypothetical protein
MSPAPRQLAADSALPEVLARAVLDPEFREALADNPARTARIAGIRLSKEDIASLKQVKPEEWDNLTLNEIQGRIGNVALAKISNVTIDV